ncbi:MAG: hypothetical protein DYG91_04270 [Chloroflexi bacterium CFX7]|nr:MAG: hypothetical protein EDM76_02545 [bacterium]MCE7927704.1 hypothetical protein [Chloroflexi bacterium CFX7]MCK6563186.1 hypothetical protein [Dehalococcoidia bacterium]MCL4232498.1 hypothetical protein [Dehalococcoidia bacterium]RIL02940.1 MAG: hypothetical protein DCC78_05730 [bacterium]
MSEQATYRPGRGYVVETGWAPPGFPARLEREGLATMCAHTIDGVYIEPRVPLGAVLEKFAQAGLQVRGFRAAGTAPSWRDGLRPTSRSRARLGNSRAAEWLPTLPPAA